MHLTIVDVSRREGHCRMLRTSAAWIAFQWAQHGYVDFTLISSESMEIEKIFLLFPNPSRPQYTDHNDRVSSAVILLPFLHPPFTEASWVSRSLGKHGGWDRNHPNFLLPPIPL